MWFDAVSFSNSLKLLVCVCVCASKAKQRAYGICALQYICFAEFPECVQGPTCAAALRELCVGEGQPRPAGTVSQGPIVFSLALLQKEWLRQPLRSGLSAHGLREQEDLPSL